MQTEEFSVQQPGRKPPVLTSPRKPQMLRHLVCSLVNPWSVRCSRCGWPAVAVAARLGPVVAGTVRSGLLLAPCGAVCVLMGEACHGTKLLSSCQCESHGVNRGEGGSAMYTGRVHRMFVERL
jgi:hypothetical protein